MIDPIGGWRVGVPSEHEIVDGMINKSRLRGKASFFVFTMIVIGMPITAVAAVLLW